MANESVRGKVLVVDDDDRYLEVTARVLRRAGYEVITRSDVIGTSHFVNAERPDLVLIDLNMPLIDGDRLAALLARSLSERPKIYLYSGIDEKTLQERAKECGADGAIPKGLAAMQFLDRIAQALRRGRQASQQRPKTTL